MYAELKSSKEDNETILREYLHDVSSPLTALRFLTTHIQSIDSHSGGLLDSVAQQLEGLTRRLLEQVDQSQCSESSETITLAWLQKTLPQLIELKKQEHLVHRFRLFSPIKLSTEGFLAKDYQVLSIISNLLNNAAEAQPFGGVIDLRYAIENDSLLIEITDSGFGMSIESWKLWQERRKFSTKESDKRGNGLAQARRFIESWGGRFDLSSNRPQGIKAAITLSKAE